MAKYRLCNDIFECIQWHPELEKNGFPKWGKTVYDVWQHSDQAPGSVIGIIDTYEGKTIVHDGDYLVTSPGNTLVVYSPALFAKQFVEVMDEKEASDQGGKEGQGQKDDGGVQAGQPALGQQVGTESNIARTGDSYSVKPVGPV